MGPVRRVDIKLPGGELHQRGLAVNGHESLGAKHLVVEAIEKRFYFSPANIAAAVQHQ